MTGRFWLFGLCLLFVTGCGGSNANFVVTGDPGGGRGTSTLLAQLYLGTGVPGATLTVLDAQGGQVAQATTDETGGAIFRDIDIPVGGQVVGTVEGIDVTFSHRLRGDETPQEPLRVGVPSTLATLYARNHPELGADAAEARVRTALGIPNGLPLGLQEPNSYFSTLAFLRAVAAAGGWESFRNDLLARMEALPAPSRGSNGGRLIGPDLRARLRGFEFNRNLLLRPILGLDARTATIAAKARREQAQILGLDERFVDTATQVRAAGLLGDAPTDLLGSFFFNCVGGLGGNILTDLVGDTLGAVLNAMGLNIGKAAQIQNIEQEVGEILTLLTTFVNAAAEAELVTELRNIEDIFTASKSISRNLQSELQSYVPTDTPSFTSSSIRALADQLGDNSQVSIDKLNSAHLRLAGTQGALLAYQSDIAKHQYGIDTPNYLQNLSAHTPAMLARTQECYEHYAALQLQMMHLLSENAHLGFPGLSSPVVSLRKAEADLAQVAENLKLQASILPDSFGAAVATSSYTFDLSTNLFWNMEVFPSTRNHDDGDGQQQPDDPSDKAAETWAAAFYPVLVYPNGQTSSFRSRLPSESDYTLLQPRGAFAPHPGVPGVSQINPDLNNSNLITGVPVKSLEIGNIGITTAGLASLGFIGLDTYYNPNPDSDVEGQMWTAASGPYEHPGYDYYVELNSDKSLQDDQAGNDLRPYLGCGTINDPGTTSLPNDLGTPPATPPEGMFILFGQPTGISIDESTITGGSVSVQFQSGEEISELTLPPETLRFEALCNYELYLGGNTTVGDDTTSTIQTTLQHFTTSQPISTVDRYSNPNQLRDRISWTSSDPSVLTMYNLPGLSGYGVPHKAGATVTITAKIMAQSGAVFTDTFTYTTPADLPAPILQSLQILPRNQIYGANSSQRARGNYPYYCIGYYSDRSYADVTSQVTWTVTPVNHSNTANLQFIASGAGVVLGMNQPPQEVPTPWNATIQASIVVNAPTPGTGSATTTLTDTTQLQIVPAVGAP